MIDKKYNETSLSYPAYRHMLEQLLAEGKTTGATQSADLIDYAKMNMQRMNRLDKTVELTEAFTNIIQKINATQHWFVLTEGWCGDAAQIVPVIAKASALNNKIHLHILLRDDNLELMDKYLTHGKSRSIPKLIVADENLEEIFNWGPRPASAQLLLDEWKNSEMPFEQLSSNLHGWYAKNKTQDTQKELATAFEATLS